MSFEFIRRLSESGKLVPSETSNPTSGELLAASKVDTLKIPKHNPLTLLVEQQRYHQLSDNLHVSL